MELILISVVIVIGLVILAVVALRWSGVISNEEYLDDLKQRFEKHLQDLKNKK